jgi:hypothetical protein
MSAANLIPIPPDVPTVASWFTALLPRGPAWQTDDNTRSADVSTLRQFWAAVATTWQELETQIGNTIGEFFCETSVTDTDWWLLDYGLPNACDPTGATACVVETSGTGQSLTFYQAVASALGYATAMQWVLGGIYVDSIFKFPGVYSTLYVQIDSAASSRGFAIITCGTWELGDEMALGVADYSGLACVLETMVPAHISIIVEII